MMFRRKNACVDILDAEKAYNEALLQLIAARTRGERDIKIFTLISLKFSKSSEHQVYRSNGGSSMPGHAWYFVELSGC